MKGIFCALALPPKVYMKKIKMLADPQDRDFIFTKALKSASDNQPTRDCIDQPVTQQSAT